MKKLYFLIALLGLIFAVSGCGGGGAGSADIPSGYNAGTPALVQLEPSRFIGQTNSFITLNAKVYDNNGRPVPNSTVTFTNMSSVGTLSAAKAKVSLWDKIIRTTTTTAVTDQYGIARINVSSTTSGFSTIIAQVYNGMGNVRDRKSVYFTSNTVLAVSMGLAVDSVPGNGIYNQTSDLTLFENDTDDTVEVLTTVYDAGGNAVAGMPVVWSADHTEATFVRQETTTNIYGQAVAVVKVTPASIRNTSTHVNIMAAAANGAANMVTLFLNPVTISTGSSSVTANPTAVNVNGTSTVTAILMLNTGSPAPNGTSVNFTVKNKQTGAATGCGTITPFGQTNNGQATATYTAPQTIPTGGVCTVTATSGGTTIGTADITITSPLAVYPASLTLTVGGGNGTLTIVGGISPYTVYSSNPGAATAALAVSTVTVTPVAAGSTTITVLDSAGASVLVPVTVNAAGGGGGGGTTTLSISPTTASVTAGGQVQFTVIGASGAYTVTSSHPLIACREVVVDGTCTAGDASTWISTSPLTVQTSPTAGTTTVTLTVVDSTFASATATLTVNAVAGSASPIAVSPETATVNQNDEISFRLSGGTPPYTINSSRPDVACHDEAGNAPTAGNANGICDDTGFWTVALSGGTFLVTTDPVATNTVVTLAIMDSVGNTKNATLTISATLSVSPTTATVNAAGGGTVTFTINGGVPNYTVTSSREWAVVGAIIPGTPSTVPVVIGAAAGDAGETATITVTDSLGRQVTAVITLN